MIIMWDLWFVQKLTRHLTNKQVASAVEAATQYSVSYPIL